MSNRSNMTRRSFLKTTGAAAAGMAFLSAKNYVYAAGANGRLNMAIIGCGGMASHGHLNSLLEMRKDENIDIVAVCDVYDTRAKEFAAKCKAAGADPKVYHDYHDVLAMKDLDYVMIASPEHQHAKMTLDALDAGKHVYCEKPLTHTIEEAQEVVAKAKKTGLKLQVGVQGTSDARYEAAHEAILAGKLGPIVEAEIDYVRNYFDRPAWRNGTTKPGDPKPADLDWEAWLGPAPKHEWSAPRYFEWRMYRDYSGGIATDLFVHRITRLLKATGLTYPERVVGMGGIYLWNDGRDLPDNMEMMAEYPKLEGVTPGMTVRVLGTQANAHKTNHCIRGQKATLQFTEEGWDIIDEASGKVVESHKKSGAEDPALHHKNHHAAIRKNVALKCPPELGLYGVVAVRMANLSWFEKKLMRWDAAKGVAVAS